MTEENPFQFIFGALSAEDKERLEQLRERSRMEADEFKHAFQRLFSELPEEHLRTLKHMFLIMDERTNDSVIATWLGMVMWELRTRFNVCVTCGVNHDEELLGTSSSSDEASESPRAYKETPLPLFYELTEADKELMTQYHLDDLRIEGTNELIGFVCTGIQGMNGPCGMRYPTIEDRMLRDPEECSGCFRKMAQG